MYANNLRRREARREKIDNNPMLCVICFKEPRAPNLRMGAICQQKTKEQYVKHKEYYFQKWKKDSECSPKRNIARIVTTAKKRAGGNITTDDIFSLWVDHDGCCAISGIKMTWGGSKIKPNTLSLDRIDPKTGYFKGNVRLVCHAINAFRQQMSDEELLMMAKAIVANMEAQQSTKKVLEEVTS